MKKTPAKRNGKKKLQHSTVSKNHANTEGPFKDFRSMYSWRERDLGEHYINNLIDDLSDWCKKEDSFEMGDFFDEQGILDGTFHKQKEKFPELKAAYIYARSVIGRRRQRMSFLKKYNANYQAILPTLRIYHQDWRDIYDEDVATGNSAASKTPANVTVVMSDFSKAPVSELTELRQGLPEEATNKNIKQDE